MENNHDIDKKFNEASKITDEPETFPSFEKVWGKIEEKLDKKENRKRSVPVWFPYSIAASLLIGFGVFYFLDKKEITGSPNPVIAENESFIQDKNKSILPAENIQKTDSVVRSNIKKETVSQVPVKNLAVSSTAVEYIASPLSAPVYDLKPQSSFEAANPVQKPDTSGENNIEEVVATGIKREKSSIMNSASRISLNNKSTVDMNSVTDTAQSTSDTSLFDRNEPQTILDNPSLSKRKRFASSTNVLAEKIENKASLNSLQGSVSGLDYTSGTVNNPIVIRGAGTFQANSDPLYILNGKVSDSKGFKNLDPNKIEKITVLKGANITALYGSKAANGVVVVETKDISTAEKKKVNEIIKNGSPEKKEANP